MDKQIAIQEILGTTPACFCCIQARVESPRAEGWWRVSPACPLLSVTVDGTPSAVPLWSWFHTITNSYPDSCLQTMLTARTQEAAQLPTTNKPVCSCNLVTVVGKYCPEEKELTRKSGQ